MRAPATLGAAAFAMIVVQLTAALHGTLVRHIACEHGGWVHAGLEDSLAVPGVAVPTEVCAGPVLVENSAAAKLEMEHEHCLTQAHRRERIVATCASTGLQFASVPELRSFAPPDDGLPRRVLYRLAPKSSPPA